MAYMDTRSGRYKLATSSQNVNNGPTQKKAVSVDVTGPGATRYETAAAQQQAATQAQRQQNAQIVGQYMAALAQQQAAQGNGSVAGENAGRAIQNAAAARQTEVTTGQPAGGGNVTYIDQNGEKQTGIAAGTEEQPETEQPETELDYWGRMKELYAQQYAEAVAANDEQAAAAAERASAAAQEQIDALGQQYAGTNRQLYRDYMMTQKALPQQMAAQGYSGGMSESARLRLNTSYEEALAENERARIAAAAGINSEAAQNQFDIQQAAAEANRQAQMQQNQYLMALEQEKYQYEQALAQARAEQMAAAGDFSGLTDMGYSQADVDYLTRIWLLENPGAKSAWIAAHPADAARLGVTAPAAARYYGSGGSGGGSSQENANDVSDMVAAGANYVEILNTIGRAYEAGEVNETEAKDLMAQAQTEVYQREHGTTAQSGTASAGGGTTAQSGTASTGGKSTTGNKTYNSVAEAGGLWNYLFRNPTTTK